MIYPRKNISEKGKPPRSTLFRSALACISVAFAVSPLIADTRTDSIFVNGTPDSRITVSDSIRIAIKTPDTMRMEFYGKPNRSAATPKTPDIIKTRNNNFRFFWTDSAGISNSAAKIFRRDFYVSDTGLTLSDTVNVSGNQTLLPLLSYMHANAADGRFLVSLVDRNYILKAYYDRLNYHLDSIGGGTLNITYASQCRLKADTFLIVYYQNSKLLGKKIYFTSSNTLAQSASEFAIAGGNCSFPSISADSSGNFLAIWVISSVISGVVSRNIAYSVYDSLFTRLDSATLPNSIEYNNMRNQHDYAPSVSFARRNFASVNWEVGKLMLRTFTIGDTGVSINSIIMDSGAIAYYPSIASNNSSLVVVWIGAQDSTHLFLKGLRYPVVNNNLNVSSGKLFVDTSLSNVLAASDTVVVNSETDSSGNIGAAWHINRTGKAAMFVKRNMLFDSGSWTSPPIRLQQGLKDSIWLDSFAVIGDAPLGTSCRIYFGVGADSTTGITNTILAGSKSVLNANSKGLYNFFQYRLSLVSSPNELKTPSIKKVFYKWNRKPYVDAIKNLYMNGSVRQAKFGDTITLMSRTDTVKCRFGVIDPDSDSVYSTVTCFGQTDNDSFAGIDGKTSVAVIYPLSKSDSVFTCRFHARDHSGWAAQDSVLYLRTRNSVPLLNARGILDESPTDTTQVTVQSPPITMQQTDSVEFIYQVSDTNDLTIMAYLSHNGVKVDSTGPNIKKHYIFRCSTGRPQGDQFNFSAADADTSVSLNIICGVDHFPHIDSISLNNKKISNKDSVSITLGSPSVIAVHATDADVVYWDTLHYSIRLAGKPETARADSAFSYTPAQYDSTVTVIVKDNFGIRDSMMFYIKFPWYETDTIKNSALWRAKKSLRDSVSLIVGGKKTDTVYIPVKNTGKDTLVISSLRFNPSHGRWLRMIVPQAGKAVIYDSLLSNFPQIQPCAPDSSVIFGAIFSVDSLKGDGLVYDTIITGTNDAMHYFDTIPVRLEYNDLPRIDSVKISFAKGKAYWLSHNTGSYTFPPHAKLSITFSEPMDSISATGAIKAFSVFDSLATSGIKDIPLTYTWSSGKKVLTISPAYSQASPYFHVKPQAGMFIPTDSIRLIVSSAITDTAKTPSGPNNLDIRRISARAPLSDTIFSYRIDSITFDLVSVSPDSADVNTAPDAPITLIFSSPPLSGTIDTSKNNNRCLVVYSSYHDSSQISFSRIIQNNDSVTFVPSKRFFYGDTVFCRYRSATIRDSLGYPVAINNNGIPVSLFDTSSSEGDKLWYFVIRDIPVKSVSPATNETNVPADKAITIIFSDTLPSGVIDTSGIGNRNLVVTSRCSNGAQIGFSSVAASGAMAVFTPSVKLYYGDSVNCSYRGLSTSDTSRYFVEKTVFAKDKTAWSFTIKNINMVSVQPESSMVSSSIHPEIVMQFSDPVYTGTFDADTSNSNRSFRLTSTFCKDTLLSLKSIKFSSDNRRIYIIPSASFFSNDSVYCAFTGFLKNITYNGNNNLPLATSDVKGSHGWYFFIQNAGFYTYPNPYKPGVDPRHCGSNGPCGIWFKNLHTLKAGVNEVIVKIFSITSHPLYSTRDAGVRIMFETGNANLKPEWKWDTRNQHGELVASGLYLYAIYDVKDNVIKKGKLIIVR